MQALSVQELQAWNERTSQGWKALLTAHPEVVSFPCDIYRPQTVAGLLQHIVAVELRYAERLKGLPETSYEQVSSDSAASLYAVHDEAMKLLSELETRDSGFWEESIQFNTRSAGSLRVSRRTVFVRLLMHSIRHYAQLATLVRQHGIAPNWPMDYLFMGITQDPR